MQQSIISVIIPVYNVEMWLKRCIESVINQTYTNIEIILVDDGSTDKSGLICDSYKSKDQRIKVIHKTNGGLSDARNAGIAIALGEYIGFVDSDDWIEPEMYEQLYNAAISHNALVACCGMNRVYENGRRYLRFCFKEIQLWDQRQAIIQFLSIRGISSAAWDKLYHRSLFHNRKYPVGKLYEDTPVTFDILLNVEKVVHIGMPYYNYFQRKTGINGGCFNKSKMDLFECIKSIRTNIISKFPDLCDYAEAFYFSYVEVLLFMLLSDKKKHLLEKKILFSEFNNLYPAAIRNDNTSSMDKIKIIIIKLRLCKIYNYLRLKK